jgi:DNA-binding GntR family transcriptional regulator
LDVALAHRLECVGDVNTNTVLRALRILRNEGLLDFRRGRGVTVSRRGESEGDPAFSAGEEWRPRGNSAPVP